MEKELYFDDIDMKDPRVVTATMARLGTDIGTLTYEIDQKNAEIENMRAELRHKKEVFDRLVEAYRSIRLAEDNLIEEKKTEEAPAEPAKEGPKAEEALAEPAKEEPKARLEPHPFFEEERVDEIRDTRKEKLELQALNEEKSEYDDLVDQLQKMKEKLQLGERETRPIPIYEASTGNLYDPNEEVHKKLF